MDYEKRKSDLAYAMGNALYVDMEMTAEADRQESRARRWMDAYADIRAALDVLRDLPVLMDWAKEHGCKSIGELLALWQLSEDTEDGSLADYVEAARPVSAAMEAAEAEAPARAPLTRSVLPGLRECRKLVGLTAEALAKMMGVSYGALGSWERCEIAVEPARIEALCEALGCTPGDLLNGGEASA